MEHEMISVKRELIKSEDDGSDGEPKLEIADNEDSLQPTNQDAVESLLLLGRQAVVSSPEQQSRQRAASLSSEPSLELPMLTLSRRHSMETTAMAKIVPTMAGPAGHDKGAVVSYYQRMRERNNEASKRCRLKRRMKAVSMENQASMLHMANKMLKQRIQRLENVGAALKDGVKKIQAGQCGCQSTLNLVRQASRDFYDPDPNTGKDMPSFEVISKSKSVREQDGINMFVNQRGITSTASSPPLTPDHLQGQFHPQQLLGNNSCSSEEDLTLTNIASPPRTYKTALDVINETIVKTLDTPLNLSCSTNATSSSVSSGPRQSLDSVGSTDSGIIKVEHSEVDSSTCNAVCIANADGTSLCRGDMLNLNKLTCYLDLVTRKVVKDDGTAAMERAIIKSRLKIPFWSADETALFICGAHRASVVHGADLNCCTMCNKRRSIKKVRMMPINMFTITYSMSLEYYTRSGHVLPIGLAVCGLCRDKHLKSIDLSNSKIISNDYPDNTISSSTSLPAKRENGGGISTEDIVPPPPVKMRQLSTNSNTSSGVSSTNGDVQIVITPVVQKQPLQASGHPIRNCSNDYMVKTVVPVSSSSGNPPNSVNIFAKIGKLNEALQAINPRYQPIGFSITSMDSCSPSVLQDAIAAAETGVYTLLSVIAPGQENQLWETIRPTLDKRLSRSK